MPQTLKHRLTEEMAAWSALIKTATADLTVSDLLDNNVIVSNSADAVALTLPAAGAGLEGVERIIANRGAGALTVVVAANYGGGSATTVTLAQGDYGKVCCDGTNWYALSHSTPT